MQSHFGWHGEQAGAAVEEPTMGADQEGPARVAEQHTCSQSGLGRAAAGANTLSPTHTPHTSPCS